MAVDEYVMTIDSDEEDVEPKKLEEKDAEDVQLDLDFVFDPSGDPYTDTLDAQTVLKDLVKTGSRPVRSCAPLLVL